MISNNDATFIEEDKLATSEVVGDDGFNEDVFKKHSALDNEKKKDFVTPRPPFALKLPFSHRATCPKFEKKYNTFLAIVKSLQVTILFSELITQIPMYVKFF